MKSIHQTVECEWVIHKSRFLGFLAPVVTTSQAGDFLRTLRQMHPDATHVCHALRLSSQETAERASDDGEPQKTAGFPMMELLKKQDLTDVLAVTVRYFGGIKLGAGGLVRAYANTIRLCLEKAAFVESASFVECRIVLPYDLSVHVEPLLRKQTKLLDAIYSQAVEFRFACLEDELPKLNGEIKKRTSSDREAEIVRRWMDYPKSE